MRHEYNCDFMAFGAHADDVELGCGGAIAKMIAEGKSGVIVDMCDASAATRGNSDDRLKEANEAANKLGVKERINLGLPDAHLSLNENSLYKAIEVIRKYRPKLILTHCESDYHTDHVATHQIIKEAWYKSSLKSIMPEQDLAPFRAHRLVYYIGAQLLEPDFAVDISAYFDQKMQALNCYQSQFAVKGSQKFSGDTYISSNKFLDDLKVRHQSMGQKILKPVAEGFIMHHLPEIKSLSDLEGEMY